MRKIKVSLVFNLLVFAMVVASLVILYSGFKFMPGYEVLVEETPLGYLKFFTLQSNIFVGIATIVMAIAEIAYLTGKISKIPKSIYILKYMGTSAVSLTFFVVFTYLGPIAFGGIPSMIKNSNLFLHCLTPIISIISFVAFDKNAEIKGKDVIYGIVPTAIYGLYYMINILIHMENGKVSTIYDWYWFVQYGVWSAIIVVPMIMAISYVIGAVLWRLNKKK